MQRINTYVSLLIIVIVGAYFRFQGLGYDLPHAYNPDDVYTMARAVSVADGWYKEALTSHQPLHTILIGLSIRALSMTNRDKSLLFLIARTLVAFASVATIIALFLLGRTLAGDAIGLVASLVFSLNILEIQYAHELYADTALAFFTILTIYILAKAYQQKRFFFLITAFCMIVVSLALKITGALLFPFYIVLSVNIVKHIKMSQNTKVFIYSIGFIITITAVIFLLPILVNELRFLQTHRFFDTSQILYEYVLRPTNYDENLRDFVVRVRDSTGTFILLTSFLGLFAALKKRNYFLHCLGVYVLFFFLTIVVVGQDMWDNNVLPILPLVSLFAGLGLAALYKFLEYLTHRSSMSFVLCAALLISGLIKSYWMAHTYTVPDTRTQEAVWFQKRGIKESHIARDAFTSITLPPSSVITSRLSKEQLSSFDYIVLSSWYSKHFSEPWRHTLDLAGLYKDIESSYKKVTEFTPNNTDVFIDDIELLTRWDSGQRIKYIRGPTLSIYTR